MSSNTLTPAPALNRASSDDEILKLTTHLPRRNGRREANGGGRDTAAQISEPRTDEQLEIDFGTNEVSKGARRSSAANAETAGTNASSELEPEHLRATLDANPELREAWREAGAYRETFATPEEARAATAQLGDLNRMDATKEYTLMFRVASGSTSNSFRPGRRFDYDANCTTADAISTVATNARVLSPANYDGTSSATGNWQSTNASLTFNNGITCGCNVTGADWQESTASSWTATRNFGLIFRVPNGFSVSTSVAHSMRIFLLENTAAAGNYVYFDDVILSQGPVTPDLRVAPLHDSQNPTVYGSLGISQHLNQGAANTFAGPVALAAGTATVTFPTAYSSAPVCTADDTSAIATVRVQTTATALTLTQSSGTDTVAYICVGNPN